jgi:tRNA(Ile)-lysidine synthase
MVVVAEWARALGAGAPKLSAATVDHGLRPEAALEAAYVAEMAGELGLDHVILRWLGKKPSTGLQEAAREARYGLLKEQAERVGADGVMLAHHAEDQAETVLMRLCAGSGLSGLAGMATQVELNGLPLLRPFLKLSGARLRATAEAAGFTPIEDPSNENIRYTRVRLRQAREILEAEGLDATRLGRLADRMRRADQALDILAKRADIAYRLPADAGLAWAPGLMDEPDEIIRRTVLHAINRLGDPLSADLLKVEACLEALLKARKTGEKTRRTLGRMLLSIDANGLLMIRPEGPRGGELRI